MRLGFDSVSWGRLAARSLLWSALVIASSAAAWPVHAREGSAATSQTPAASDQAQPTGSDALRVFLDCGPCDFDFLRIEIPYVNYVRDRRDAQVHVLVTTEGTGGGGRAWTIDFVGLETFAGIDDQLVYYSTQDDTEDAERRGFAQMFELGLVQYAMKTPLAGQLEISQNDPAGQPAAAAAAQPDDDPWNFWVFRARFNTRLDVEEQESTKSFGGSFSGNRTTAAWKINLGANVDYDQDEFELSDGGIFTNVRRSNAVTARFVKSLGDHMGLGFGGSAVTTTFRNQDLTLRIAPAVEYNFFPYDESTRRQFTVTYAMGWNSFRYDEPTIFDRLEEDRINHNVVASLDLNEPWGESGLTLEFSQFLDEASQYRLVGFGDVEFRLFRGFFLSIRGDASLIRDQIFLPKRGATDEEILVRRRQLATDYEYSIRVGITYSFGSIYNNVVNSRFAGSSGGFIRAF